MPITEKTQETAKPGERHAVDVVVVGAGFAGLGMLHALRELGLSVQVYEAGGDVGGTWYWNRYPGARTDSECYYYCFSFSQELLEEWNWSERYPGQPEMSKYLRHVAEKFDLRKNIQFNTRVKAAAHDEATNRWLIDTDRGDKVAAKYFISAMGYISEPHIPDLPGLETFEGEWHHTARWPHKDIDFTGKRVGIIGAGASAVQALPIVAESAAHVALFQRTPNYVFPARNRPMDPEWQHEIKKSYPRIIQKCRNQMFAMPFFNSPTDRLAVETPPEKRNQIYEDLWRKGSFRFFFESFDDLLTNPEANETAAEFIRSKIRETVKDPHTAELLVPKNHPLFAKRPPAEHGYYEAFNRHNVTLVDVANQEPIKGIIPTGVRTTETDYEFDILILATGFDAVTGALERVDIRGKNGISLRDKWQANLRTYLGLCTNGYPNMFMITGPQTPFANLPTLIEENIKWITVCIEYMQEHNLDKAEATEEAEQAWTEHTEEAISQTMMQHGDLVNSWFLGANVPGRRPNVLAYFGGADNYIKRCDEVMDAEFEGIEFKRSCSRRLGGTATG